VQNMRIANVEESCHSFAQQSHSVAQATAKCTELDAKVKELAQNMQRGEAALPGRSIKMSSHNASSCFELL